MDLREAFRHALDGNATLFVGAGFSAEATNEKGQKLLVGDQLAARLAAELSLTSIPQLDVVADMYVNAKGAPQLVDLLRALYTVKNVSSNQLDVFKPEWRRIYTTNYDNVVETVQGYLGKPGTPVTLAEQPSDYTSTHRLCVHLNGYIERLNQHTLNNEFKLSRTSYLTDLFRESVWSSVFRDDISLSRSVIFIGYSLRDLDIARILFEYPEWREKCVFVTAPDPEEEERHVLSKFGCIEPSGLMGAAEILREVQHTYSSPIMAPIYHSFRRANVCGVPIPPDDDMRFDLLLRGLINNSALRFSLANASVPYYIRRQALTRITEGIKSGTRNFVIHSHLGNGKTLVLDGLTAEAAAYDCFTFLEERPGLLTEMDNIKKGPGTKIVIIENYERHFPLLRQIARLRDPGTILVVATRTAIHDVNFERLFEIIPEREIQEIDINYLTDQEIDGVIALLDASGTWGVTSRRTLEQKRRLLKMTHHRQFQAILVDIINSPEIRRRLQGIVDEITQDKGLHNLVVSGLIADVLAFSNKLPLLVELVGLDSALQAKHRNDPVVRELVSFDHGGLRVQSSIVGRFILTELEQGDRVLEVLVRMAERSAFLKGSQSAMGEIFNELVKFSNIERLLPKKEKEQTLVNYYERIKNLGENLANPYYWLQYAIARLSFQDFEKAGTFFENAYGRAKQLPWFDTFHIDNHFARYLLRKAVHDGSVATSYESFSQANAILQQQVRRTKTHYYPYRVALFYNEFFDQFFDDWTGQQQGSFMRACQMIVDRIQSLRGRLRSDLHVQRCEASLRRILAAA